MIELINVSYQVRNKKILDNVNIKFEVDYLNWKRK